MGYESEPLSDGVWAAVARRGVSRRDFLKFCSVMTGALALPMRYSTRIAQALEQTTRPALVWLEFQDCAGNTESALRASHPAFADIVLDLLSWNYHETVMAPSGAAAEKSLSDTIQSEKGRYIAVIEGSIPLAKGGVYCTVGGRTAIDIAREVTSNAFATIAVGTCAAFGGIPAAAGGVTGAVSVAEALPGIQRLVNLSACPMNGANLAATLVHYLTFKEMPATDQLGRPLFAHGERIHDHCPRRAHYDAGQFVQEWGDEGHQQGWCLYKMGCKGPATNYNCPQIQWNDGTNWPIGVGHGCVGCAQPGFWDAMTPFYRQLPSVPGFGVESTATTVGVGVVATVAGLTAAHAIGSAVRQRRLASQVTSSASSGEAAAADTVPVVARPDGQRSSGARSENEGGQP
ncbi:MAG TPA: hydrogenase small subunit [Ktedonobacterales bacterium]|nr:hydrogenase small subunit [Ktedonobacterales bacterium]